MEIIEMLGIKEKIDALPVTILGLLDIVVWYKNHNTEDTIKDHPPYKMAKTTLEEITDKSLDQLLLDIENDRYLKLSADVRSKVERLY